MMARSWWGCIVITRTWWCRRWSIMKTRIWWVWWLLWQEHIVMHLMYPSPLLTDSNGSEVCSDVVFHVNTNHSYNLNTPFFQISQILNMSSVFMHRSNVHLALDPSHPEVRKGCDDITKWRKPSNFETVKPKTFSCTLNSCYFVFYLYIVVSTHLTSLKGIAFTMQAIVLNKVYGVIVISEL